MILEFMDMGDLTNLIHGYRDLAYGEDLMAAISFQVCVPFAAFTPCKSTMVKYCTEEAAARYCATYLCSVE